MTRVTTNSNHRGSIPNSPSLGIRTPPISVTSRLSAQARTGMQGRSVIDPPRAGEGRGLPLDEFAAGALRPPGLPAPTLTADARPRSATLPTPEAHRPAAPGTRPPPASHRG